MDVIDIAISKKYTAKTAQGMGAIKGDKGDKGDQGEQGIQGPQGIQGIQGEKGEKGEQGLPGVDGADGADGVDGVSVTVVEHGANDATNYRLEVTTKDGTIVTQNLIGRGCKWLEGTELTSTQEYTVLEIADSCDGDYYLNKDTCYVYHRVDDDTTANKWYYVGTLQGIAGDDAYEVAVKEGFVGTRAEWLASLVGRVELVEKVWEKPSLVADTTELDTWYYYKVNNPDNDLALAGVEEGNAWFNKCVMVATKDYPPSNYAYYNGLRYLCFTDGATTLPALTDPDHIYYVLYNEKEKKCTACRCNLDGSSHEMLTNTWVDVFESATLPDGYEEVMLTEYTQLGKWVQTVYIGNSKEFAHEVTITTGANMQGFVTSTTLLALLGEGNLKTVDQTIKGAINEHETLLRGNNNSKVLNTKEKDVFGAINEIFSRHYENVAKCEETSVRAFCDKYVIEKGADAELTSYFFYSMGIATDVPEGNNRWGYCHCIITQDPQYKILIYYAPDLRKVFMTYSGDTGWSNEWTSNLTNEDIVTTYSANVTDSQVFSAKAMHGEFKKGFNGIARQGLTIPENDMNNLIEEGINEAVVDTTNTANFPPVKRGITRFRVKVEILATNAYQQQIEFQAGVINRGTWIRFYVDNEWSAWEKVCATTIPTVPVTEITSFNTAHIKNIGASSYYVENGWCHLVLELQFAENAAYGWNNIIDTTVYNIPIPKMKSGTTKMVLSSKDVNPRTIIVAPQGGGLGIYGHVLSGEQYFGSVSYPVADGWRP